MDRYWLLGALPEQHLIIAGNERGQLLAMSEKMPGMGLYDWRQPIRVLPSLHTYYVPIMRPVMRPDQLDLYPTAEFEEIIVRRVRIADMELYCGFGPQTQTWVIQEQAA